MPIEVIHTGMLVKVCEVYYCNCMSHARPEVAFDIDLFGNNVKRSVLLREKFIEPPFSVLDARTAYWQKRKQNWLALGIKSELGRDAISLAQGLNRIDFRESYTGKSVFDSALSELMYEWFCPVSGSILDPFAGGSVRGIVAGYLGYHYTGIELRKEQVESNRQQASAIELRTPPTWICGDSTTAMDSLGEFDFVFSCPPYFDLEVYSNLATDLSNMSWKNFLSAYSIIISKCVQHLVRGGMAVFVVGDIRDSEGYYRDFIGETKSAFKTVGARLYNEMVLLENGLNTAAMRADKQFTSNRKVVKVHQNVLCFIKP